MTNYGIEIIRILKPAFPLVGASRAGLEPATLRFWFPLKAGSRRARRPPGRSRLASCRCPGRGESDGGAPPIAGRPRKRSTAPRFVTGP